MLEDKSVRSIVRRALEEDRAWQDRTSLAVPAQARAEAKIVAQEKGVLCGLPLAVLAFRQRDPGLKTSSSVKDGAVLRPGKTVLTVRGRARSILSAERTALNFLQHLSGISTHTRAFAEKARGTRTAISDTRKTLPGLRDLEKYAVRCGGGTNHRRDLDQAVLLKDNHWPFLGKSWKEPSAWRGKFVQWEAQSLSQVERALRQGVGGILLDNMSIPQLKKAVALIRKSKKRVLIEISGGVRLENVRALARLGCDRISVGALTHSSPALNFHLDVRPL